jgi:three-Cys-motif partner protein
VAKKNTDAKNWIMKPQTEVKLDLLTEYLKRWMSILGRPTQGITRTLHYIDGFAGRGLYATGEEGSPLRAMGILHSVNIEKTFGAQIHAHLIEIEPSHQELLEKAVKDAQKNYPSVTYEIRLGDFKLQSKEIFKKISLDHFTFCFIDPFGFDCVDLDFIVELMKSRSRVQGDNRTEFFINLMTRHLNWTLDDAIKSQLWNKIFGTDKWQKLIGEKNRISLVVKLYCEQIRDAAKKLGLTALVYPIGIKPEGEADMYYLIHVSFNPKARQVMEVSTQSIHQLEIPQFDLFGSVKILEDIVNQLKNTKPITYLQLCGLLWHIDYSIQKNHILEAMRSLENDRTIVVTAHDGRKRKERNGGFEEKDLISLKLNQ